jgi:hypothetical protein
MPKPQKNENLLKLILQIGKDIGEIKNGIGGTSQGSSSVEVLKVTVPAATNEDIDNRALCVATLPKEFQGALLIYELYGSWLFLIGENEIGFPMQTTETEMFIVKLADFKSYTKEVTARIIKGRGGSSASDA